MDNSNPQSVNSGHEGGDISVGGIVKSAVVLVVLGVFSFFVATGVMRFFEWGEVTYLDKKMPAAQEHAQAVTQAIEKVKSSAAMPADGAELSQTEKTRIIDEMHVQTVFPEPRLQYDDVSDMAAMHERENKRLTSQGADATGNYIPIDRAIDLLAKRGLPPVNGTFTPVNLAPTSVVVPLPPDIVPMVPAVPAKVPAAPAAKATGAKKP
jgi:hypothetical protein